MYGILNKSIKELIIEKYDDEKWELIKSKTKVDDSAFISYNTNPDSITYDMVGAVVEVLEVKAEDFLEELGEFWLLYTAKEGYGELLDISGDNIVEFLSNVNHLHLRLASVMPDLKPPRFEAEQTDESTLLLHYYSDRPGLTPLVKGIINGLGKRFGQTFKTELVESKGDKSDHDVFKIIF